jgi:hypothetical protein
MNTPNTTHLVPGRFGNSFIVNILCSLLAKKYNFKIDYKWLEQTNALGFSLFTGGETGKGEPFIFSDGDFERFLGKETLENTNIILRHFYQTPECARIIRNSLDREKINQANIFRERYNNNNDAYVHVRLGDAWGLIPVLNIMTLYCPIYRLKMVIFQVIQ